MDLVKKTILGVLLIISLSSKAQKERMFIDSLVRGDSSTWIRKDGIRFTETKHLCSFGSEYIFYRNHKVIKHDCVDGSWLEILGTWALIARNGRHYIKLNYVNNLSNEVEIQLVGNGNHWVTRISEEIIATRTINFYFINK